MKRLAISVSVLFLSAAAVTGAEDPVAVRQALMQANAASAGAAAGMMKGELDYNPAVAKAAIMTFHATSHSVGDYFPEGTDTGDTTAAPAIWEDPEGFAEALAKFKSDAAAAAEASGREGPAGLDAFQAVAGPVLSNCRSCHETFRIQKN